MSILVREAVITDIEDIIEFEKGCFANPWSDNSIFSELINYKSYYIVFYDKMLSEFIILDSKSEKVVIIINIKLKIKNML